MKNPLRTILDGIATGSFRSSDLPEVSLTASSWLNELGGVPSVSGEHVTPRSAMRLSAVYSCVRLLSDTIGQLPLTLLRNLVPRGVQPATNHALYSLLKDSPNPEMTSFEFRRFQQRGLELRGNAYAQIIRSGNGRIAAIWALRPDYMTVYRDRESKELRYLYGSPTGSVAFTADEIWHLRGPSLDGVIGLSPIQEASETFAAGQAMQKYGNEFFANGSAPMGILKSDKKVEKEVADRVIERWERAHKAQGNRHRIAVTEQGMEYQAISISPEDMQFLESISANDSAIAGIFGVPNHLINHTDKSTSWGKGIEQQFIGYIQLGIMPRLILWEQGIVKDLLLPGERGSYQPKFNVAGLQRGDFLSRMQGYALGRNGGWWSVNDIRALEDQNPIEGGDVYLQPLNMAPATDAPAGADTTAAEAGDIPAES